MRRTRCHVLRRLAVLLAGGWLVLPIGAVEPTNSPSLTTNKTVDPTLPPMPVARSPVDTFRELLVMPAAERKLALAIYPPLVRQRILEKLGEYQILPLEAREYRLRATELRWYLLPLLETDATNRAAQLEAIPGDVRPLVESRLTQWELLPPSFQQELLANEDARRYLTQPEFSTPEQREKMLAALSPARRALLEAGIVRLQALPEEERSKTFEQFKQFFDLTDREKEMALRTLSDAERRQMEKTLEQFSRLTREQRNQCLRSFERFASLSLAERQQFLTNAERWAQMSPDERQAWRELVGKVPDWPPLPPMVIPLPPMPPARRPNGVPVATNGN